MGKNVVFSFFGLKLMSLKDKNSPPKKNILMQSTMLSSICIEHKKRVHINLSNQRTSKCSDIPLSDQIFQDQEEEDKSPSHSRKEII
jgi:hypothetical protein